MVESSWTNILWAGRWNVLLSPQKVRVIYWMMRSWVLRFPRMWALGSPSAVYLWHTLFLGMASHLGPSYSLRAVAASTPKNPSTDVCVAGAGPCWLALVYHHSWPHLRWTQVRPVLMREKVRCCLMNTPQCSHSSQSSTIESFHNRATVLYFLMCPNSNTVIKFFLIFLCIFLCLSHAE